MTDIDIFNGDADGICALHQLRLADPRDSQLITGVKRDIALLEKVEARADDRLTVLDISLEKNHKALLQILDTGASVTYADHHYPGDIPDYDNLEVHIDTDPEACTGLIINRLLDGAYLSWAVTAAFGDNLLSTATAAAKPLQLTHDQLEKLRTLGTLLNYNGYGADLDDLYFRPDELFRRIQPYADPLAFIAQENVFDILRDGYAQDHERAHQIKAERSTEDIAIFVFPNESFARRISGVYANELAQAYPDRAHALLTELDDGCFLVSVRAPVNRRSGADELCRQFETGGGRKAAAGINRLPANDIDRFSAAMAAQFQPR